MLRTVCSKMSSTSAIAASVQPSSLFKRTLALLTRSGIGFATSHKHLHVVSFITAEVHRNSSSHQIFSCFPSAYHKFQTGLTTIALLGSNNHHSKPKVAIRDDACARFYPLIPDSIQRRCYRRKVGDAPKRVLRVAGHLYIFPRVFLRV